MISKECMFALWSTYTCDSAAAGIPNKLYLFRKYLMLKIPMVNSHTRMLLLHVPRYSKCPGANRSSENEKVSEILFSAFQIVFSRKVSQWSSQHTWCDFREGVAITLPRHRATISPSSATQLLKLSWTCANNPYKQRWGNFTASASIKPLGKDNVRLQTRIAS